MRFEPSLPAEPFRLSVFGPLREAGVLVGAVAGAAFLFVAVVGGIVDLLAPLVPARFERYVVPSAYFARERRLAADLRDVEALLARLGRRWPENPYALRLDVTKAAEANAFAYPGGLVVVTSGLLQQAESENELAFVLAHEVGHFRNRDHLRRLGRIAGLGLLQLVLSLGAGEGANAVGALGGHFTDRVYDRAQESAADRFALEAIHAEYGHVAGAPAFFERILRRDGAGPRGVRYLSTHPLTPDRIAALRRLAAARGFAADGPLHPVTWRTAHARREPAAGR